VTSERAQELRLEPETCEFYCQVIRQLSAAGAPFLVGGAYAFERYVGIARHTKDFDIFVRPRDRDRVLELLSEVGCQTDLTFPHWLGKAFRGEDFVDVIFSSGNGVAEVDDAWFEHAVDDEVFGLPVRLCAPEEMIWQKSFVMERERYDGADVAHLLRARAQDLDWQRLLGRFGEYWRVLLSHLTLFGFIYPGERNVLPSEVMAELIERLKEELHAPPPADRLCQGPLLSRAQYLVDLDYWHYQDARLRPRGNMTRGDTAHWTAAIEEGT
jgi:hypothetical protein